MAEDVLRRVEVTAPVSGTVQNLKVFTIGQVVRPGEPLLDIVPEKERLIVEAQFRRPTSTACIPGRRRKFGFRLFIPASFHC